MNYYKNIKEELLKNEVYKRSKDYSKNRNDLDTYYKVGDLLVQAQGGKNRAKYGDKLIEEYSKKLTRELGKGYSVRNLKNMRKFYLFCEKGHAVRAQLTWTHYRELLKINDINEINYYVEIIEKQNLSTRELISKIKLNEYGRLDKKTKEKLVNKEENKIEDFIKNPIIIKNTHYEEISEYALKQLILEDIDSFLKELGTGFSYIANEYKIKIGCNYHYIDLLLYNIKYNCYVVVELKITSLKAEHIGQVRKYMNYIDKNIKENNQDNTIGIIIVKHEDKLLLEYISDCKIFTTSYITI